MQYPDKIAKIGLFSAFAIILGVVESFFPLPVPGVKLGLANIGVLLALYSLTFFDTLIVVFLKSVFVGIFAGNVVIKVLLSLPSTLAAAFVMFLYIRLTGKLTSPVSASALGGAVHIVCQFIILKVFIIKNLAIYSFLPYFSLLSIFTGMLTGYLTCLILKHTIIGTK